eukprot:CAMPEP_0202050860 /NCGR_PEP_ID=MMETSP0963-20130614/4261_1 /ASSEMBLY_ACC=CAM_ASM_000494 /TAXON_ID=4773 /ORGANISM="Schizochytrium aggregatum, Strain ATCC28209" /LENGTH=221 /DNA_ID=CAMNT_0048615981 /DNA_START=228 /DNA_END=895 /DNA_ORIENTATION=+
MTTLLYMIASHVTWFPDGWREDIDPLPPSPIEIDVCTLISWAHLPKSARCHLPFWQPPQQARDMARGACDASVSAFTSPRKSAFGDLGPRYAAPFAEDGASLEPIPASWTQPRASQRKRSRVCHVVRRRERHATGLSGSAQPPGAAGRAPALAQRGGRPTACSPRLAAKRMRPGRDALRLWLLLRVRVASTPSSLFTALHASAFPPFPLAATGKKLTAQNG